MGSAVMPNAVGHDLVEAEIQFGRSAGQGEQEFGIQKRLAAGEAERADAERVGGFQEADCRRDVEPVGPFDRHAAVRAVEIALIRAGKGDVPRAEGAAHMYKTYQVSGTVES